MSEITENQIEKILDRLMKSDLTAYYIAKKTGISEQTILNYRSKKTYPTESNAKLLEYFFNDKSVNSGKRNSENNVTGNNNIIGDHSTIDMRRYNSDSPDVLRAQIDLLEERIREKDAQIREKDAQIREKDAQIKDLHEIIKQLSRIN
jgi:transcriptional regulator with XRE-family HTH domain